MSHKVNKDRFYKCKYCCIKFPNKVNFKYHLCTFYSKGQCEYDGTPYILRELSIPSRYLKKELEKFKTTYQIRINSQKYTFENYFCKECNRGFKSEYEFIKHQVSKGKVLRECEICTFHYNVATAEFRKKKRRKNCSQIYEDEDLKNRPSTSSGIYYKCPYKAVRKADFKFSLGVGKIKTKIGLCFCTRCGTRFESYKQLSRHFFSSAHHRSTKRNICTEFLEKNLRAAEFQHPRVKNLKFVLGISGEEYRFVHENKLEHFKQQAERPVQRAVKLKEVFSDDDSDLKSLNSEDNY